MLVNASTTVCCCSTAAHLVEMEFHCFSSGVYNLFLPTQK